MADITAGSYLRHLDDGKRIYVIGRSHIGGWLWCEVRGDGSWGRTRRTDLDEGSWAVEGRAEEGRAEEVVR